jgi:hypothetical protein
MQWAGLAGAGLALGFKPAIPAITSGSLRILTTARAFSASVADEFTRQTGAALTIVLTDNPISLAEADLAIVPSYSLTRFIQYSQVGQLGSGDSPVSFEQRAYDPFNAFSLSAAHGLIGINARVTQPPGSWGEFFTRAQTQPTHLPPADSFAAALKRHGHSINTRDTVDRNTARATLAPITSVPLEQATLAIGAPLEGWQFAVPSEGAERWEDCFCLPSHSAQPELARAFIAFSLQHQSLMPLPSHVPLEMRSPFAPPLG